MLHRRRFFAMLLVPLIATVRFPPLSKGFVLVNGWICKASDLQT
jgi:hypothetical protein